MAMATTRMHVNRYSSLLDDVLGLHSTSLDVSQGQGFRGPRTEQLHNEPLERREGLTTGVGAAP
jgi:hypothetical protein